jgi:ribose transport system permease protein
VFFGATQFKSRPNVWGTILALYTLAFGVKGLQLAFQNGVYWITPLFNGVALVVAVALASRQVAAVRRRRTLNKVRPGVEPTLAGPDVG